MGSKRFLARYFDGSSAHQFDAELWIHEGASAWELRAGEHWSQPIEIKKWNVARDKPGCISLRNFKTEELIEVYGDNLDEFPISHSYFDFVPRQVVRTLVILLAALLTIIFAIYQFSGPISKKIAERIPASWEEKLASSVSSQMKPNLCQDEPAQKVLNDFHERITNALGFDRPSSLGVWNLPEPNAFALPGGSILFTQGLIKEAESTDELIAIFAHELGHVHHRHVMAAFVRGALFTIIWQAAIGDYSGFFVIDPVTLMNIAQMRFSREAEEEADQFALQALERLQVSSAGMARFFERMEKRYGSLEKYLGLLSTHPLSAKRKAQAEEQPTMKELARAQELLSDEELKIIRAGCLVAETPPSQDALPEKSQ